MLMTGTKRYLLLRIRVHIGALGWGQEEGDSWPPPPQREATAHGCHIRTPASRAILPGVVGVGEPSSFFSGVSLAPTSLQRGWRADTGLQDALNVRERGWLVHPRNSTGQQFLFWSRVLVLSFLAPALSLHPLPRERRVHSPGKLLSAGVLNKYSSCTQQLWDREVAGPT